MKTNPFLHHPTDTVPAFAAPIRDASRYRAEHPSKSQRRTRQSLQRWIIYVLLALTLIGLFTAI